MAQNLECFKQYKTTDLTEAYKYAGLVLADLDTTVVNEDVALIYSFMAEYNETILHHYSDALNYLLCASGVYEEIGHSQGIAHTDALLGRVFLRNSDYHNAFRRSIKALNEAKAIGDSTIMREAYLSLEQIDYFYNNNQEQALEYNYLVSESYENSEQARQTVRALNNRFNYNLTPENVEDILTRCETICIKYGFNDLLLNVYLNTALQEFMFENIEAATHYFDKAEKLISNFKEEGYYYSAMGFFYLNTNNTTEAIRCLKHSIELLGNGDFDSKNIHSYFLLQDTYYNQGRYREAYDALMSFAEIYTQQYNTQNIVELSKLINDMEVKQARQEHIREQEHHKMITGLYALSFVVILILVFLLFSRYRLERKNRELQKVKAEQEINHKNEIIKIQKLQQYQDKSYTEKLVEELSNIANLGNHREMQSQLRRIIHQLYNNTKNGGGWAEIEMTLANGNNTFYDNLLKEYPNLTKNERRLCLFIHMKMSTKEISDITHQSPTSINVARSRLRQKFGINGDDTSLIAFLDKFNTSQKTK